MIFPVKHIPNTVILANGEFSTHPFPLEILHNAETLICCDGAVNNLIHAGFVPDYIVGDCDSISEANFNRYKAIIVQDKDVEYNDLQKSIRFAISQQKDEVLILGGGGLREDHTLANLSITVDYAQHLSISMMTNYGIFIPIHSPTTFSTFAGQQVSIFSFNKENVFTFHGLRYPVVNRKFSHLWEGSLNEALGDEIRIDCTGDGIVIFFAF